MYKINKNELYKHFLKVIIKLSLQKKKNNNNNNKNKNKI